MVTTAIEHPSAYDAARMYAEKTGKEFRVAKANPENGGVDVDEILKLVNKDTCLLSVMSASNISGKVFPMKEIVEKARQIKPDLFIISDAVQHAPHAALYAHDLQLDGLVIAPYKAMGIRGCGYGYVSDRVAACPMTNCWPSRKRNGNWGLPSRQLCGHECMVDYICWIGRHYTDIQDRRTQYVVGFQYCHAHENSLLERMLEAPKPAGPAPYPGRGAVFRRTGG